MLLSGARNGHMYYAYTDLSGMRTLTPARNGCTARTILGLLQAKQTKPYRNARRSLERHKTRASQNAAAGSTPTIDQAGGARTCFSSSVQRRHASTPIVVQCTAHAHRAQ